MKNQRNRGQIVRGVKMDFFYLVPFGHALCWGLCDCGARPEALRSLHNGTAYVDRGGTPALRAWLLL